jgi:hypothetical protein
MLRASLATLAIFVSRQFNACIRAELVCGMVPR